MKSCRSGLKKCLMKADGELMKADVVVDLAYGDCGKGKVTYNLLKEKRYTHCVRFNGGNNCGHTIIHNDKKIITHSIPAGVFFGVRSIIGPGCVLNVKSFIEELNYLEDNGVYSKSSDLIKIADNVHIITDSHLEEELKESRIGTTKKGIGPAYRDKYARVGIRASEVEELAPFLTDFYDEIFWRESEPEILFEAGQGFYLDPNFGDYPYVTSSHCTVAGALLNGVPHTAIRDVYGVAKVYDTYVGAKKFQPDDDSTLCTIGEVGKEFGATTGRQRQCNYLNLIALEKAVRINAVNNLIFNKTDILKQLNVWKILDKQSNELKIIDLKSERIFKEYIMERFWFVDDITFSYSAEII